MFSTVKTSVILFALFTLLTGAAYPLAVTGIVWLLFPAQAGGSIILKGGRPVGSALIGQHFDDPGYFWGRPSATKPCPYNASSSAGSNLGQSNPAFIEAVRERASRLGATDPGNGKPVPIDLVTASASGLDPHISPEAAEFQVRRVAEKQGLEKARVRALVAANTEGRLLGIFGEPRINVLKLNLALDDMK